MTAETMNDQSKNKQIEKVDISQIKLASDPFEVMDQMDDEIIIKEIEGRIVDTWVYHFKDETGREQWGLSKVGVDASCAELAKKGEVIRELDVSYQVDPTDKQYVLFTGKAARYAVARDGKEVLLDTAIGTKRQGLFTIKRDGSTIKNPFWFEQGAMKALRNARSRLISEEIKSKIIAFAKKQGKTQDVITPLTINVQPKEEKGKPTVCPICHATGKYHSPTCANNPKNQTQQAQQNLDAEVDEIAKGIEKEEAAQNGTT